LSTSSGVSFLAILINLSRSGMSPVNVVQESRYPAKVKMIRTTGSAGLRGWRAGEPDDRDRDRSGTEDYWMVSWSAWIRPVDRTSTR
jgi:hypothetical protein